MILIIEIRAQKEGKVNFFWPFEETFLGFYISKIYKLLIEQLTKTETTNQLW